MVRSQLSLAIAALLAQLCAAQSSAWIQNQVNATMCQWNSPRAAVIRDTLYIDGGYLWWVPGMADGSIGAVQADGNPKGLVYALNFSIPFKTSDNISSVMTTISKASGGGNVNNIGPQYYDGAMFANDYEWWTYGGQLGLTDAFEPPDANAVAAYYQYQSGPPRQFEPGFTLEKLPTGLTRYVTNGASVSVPSENLGFYFGGLRASDWGPIYYTPGNASQLSTTLVELDMSKQLQETWGNFTLPSSVNGRANAELVWVPVGERGVLVAIGGVIFPSYATANQKNNASATSESQRQSPDFMSTVSVYDIASKTWYEQKTSGSGPGQLTQGCTVLASAPDSSSHSIYWYGGYDGLNPTSAEAFSDDVWVLSIPSFFWTKVKTGTPSHARAGHRCTKPYPDQMLVVGGYTALSGTSLKCVEGGIVQIFNLSSAEWITSYDPQVWSNYSVPSPVYANIGGSATGGATQASPSPSGFTNASMSTIFGTAYNTTKITKWYPYKLSTGEVPTRTVLPAPKPKDSSTPSYLAPVLGVVLGLFFITLVILAVLLYRRRKFLKVNGTATQSEAGTMDNRRWVTTWLRGTPADAKAPTVTTDETPMSAYEEEHQTYVRPAVPEMGEGQVHELMDTSRPVELHGTGFVPVHSSSRNRSKLAASASVTSHASTVSRVSQSSISGPHRPAISPVGSPRPDSPDLLTTEQHQRRIVSGMSGISDTDRGHLRGISETSVSTTDGAFVTPMEGLGGRNTQQEMSQRQVIGPDGRPLVVSPLTPPQGVGESNDYLGAAGSSSSPGGTRRKSNFSEGLDETDRR